MKKSKTMPASFVNEFNFVVTKAHEFIRETLKSKKKIPFGTNKELENENYVVDNCPQVLLYDYNGTPINYFVVGSIEKDENGGINLNLIGINENWGETNKVNLGVCADWEIIYIAESILNKI